MFAWLKRAGLSWKVQLAPFLLILILLALGAYALLTLRDNQIKLDALMAGPVRQAELAADLNSAIWAAHAKLYRLAATAANETDSNKILAMAKEASAASAKILDAVKAVEDFQGDDATKTPALQKLRAAATSYLKQSKNAIEMADGDAGSAMMFIKGAERPFAEIDKLTDELGVQSTDARDREIARSSVRLDQQQRMLGLVILAVSLAGFAISFRIGRGISKPVVAMASAMRELAGGKFDVRLPGLERADEVGQMARAVDEFKVQAIAKAEREAAEREQRNRELSERQQEELQRLADKFEAAVGEIIETVSHASNDLETAAQGLSKNTETTRELSVKVSAASAETSSNVQSVASATEEMASSVTEISRQVQESSRVASEAVDQARQTDSRIIALSEAADRIGDVTGLITTIAEQTNLLALNATIEAARAGEAGRGFAVVAQEVKALASQTAKATGDITAQVAAIQAATRESVTAIKEIGETIGRVSEIAATIAAAIEEQGAATQEIARNVQQAALGTNNVAGNVAEVERSATDAGSASSQVLSSAHLLAGESTRLKQEMERFLATVRAA
jgi:methyl-accepting chemotaxis protein